MTVPKSIFLPTKKDGNGDEGSDKYLLEMIYEVQRMYDNLAKGINGDIKSSFLSQKQNWTPTLEGTGVTGTFTYTNQYGWVLRQGLMVDVWADIWWTASGGATGNLYVVLPYIVANSSGGPFVGSVQSSIFAYGAGQTYVVINAMPNTYRGEFWASGSGVATTRLAVPNAGHLLFHVRYLGVQDEY